MERRGGRAARKVGWGVGGVGGFRPQGRLDTINKVWTRTRGRVRVTGAGAGGTGRSGRERREGCVGATEE